MSIALAMASSDSSPAADTSRASRAAAARKLSGRRRHIDPTTCDREYSAAETEFMSAIQIYKYQSGRMFPTWSETLEVLVDLGYRKTGSPANQS